TQHVLRKVEFFRNLADGSESFWPLGHCPFHRNVPTASARVAYASLSSRPSPLTSAVLILCLRTLLGLNTITRRGEIGTSSPVFGLRPTRSPFLRTRKEPKDESFTDSPRMMEALISSSTSSTSVADSVRDSPTF